MDKGNYHDSGNSLNAEMTKSETVFPFRFFVTINPIPSVNQHIQQRQQQPKARQKQPKGKTPPDNRPVLLQIIMYHSQLMLILTIHMLPDI